MLKFVIDCDADAAWRALHSPRAVAELYGPFMEMEPLGVESFPTRWESGADVAVGLSVGGALPLGRQLIHATDRFTTDERGPVRIFRDSGTPLTGPLAALDVWDHQIAVAPAPGDPGRTLWRDRLVIGGAAAPALWPVLWAMWQWRQARIKALAHTWAYDIPPGDAQESPPRQKQAAPPAEAHDIPPGDAPDTPPGAAQDTAPAQAHHIPPAEAGEGELPD